MMGVQLIQDMVRDGRVTPEDGALLLAMRAEIMRARKRRAFWRGFRDGFTLGPLWRWIERKVRRS